MSTSRARAIARLRLTRLAIGGWAAQALFAANQLGLFDLLAEHGPLSSAEIAGHLGTDADATARLLGALVALDVLERDRDRFANGLAAGEFLVSGTPESMTAWVTLIGRWNQTFGRLDEAVRIGEPAEAPEEHLGESPDYTRHFILGMHDYAIGPGRELARHLDISGRRRLLDVGGGPGTYSILLAEANPELRCTVYDLPDVVRIAVEVIERHGLSNRVDTASGDYHTDRFPEGFDVALVSNVLHQEDEESCLRILRESFRVVEPGGLGVIHAMPLNEARDGPVWPALHNLLMLLVYRGGRAWTTSDYCRMLTEAGFRDPEPHSMSVFNAGSFIVATRP